MSILEVQNLTKRFGGMYAVDNLSFNLSSGKALGITGPNGSGKTTVFNLITGFLAKNSGSVRLGGNDITEFSAQHIAALGIVRTFQQSRLFGSMSVMENVLAGIRHTSGERIRDVWFTPGRVRREAKANQQRAINLLEQTGITFAYDQRADSLSYGQQKLVEITRALATEPKVLLLDEPTSGVDPVTIDKISDLVLNLLRQGMSMIVIEHNISFLKRIADKILILDRGREVATGAPEEVINRPEVIKVYIGDGNRRDKELAIQKAG